tara:strand:- start:125 stop:424 length:300 start_codon:yes stop_codon:yes gene_type:complete
MIISKKYGIIYRILINMIIKYFSWVKDIVGKSEETISISPDIDTPEKLIDFLITKNEQYKKAFSKRETIKVAQNKIYISKSTKIKNDDEIAFFPPVTGG